MVAWILHALFFLYVGLLLFGILVSVLTGVKLGDLGFLLLGNAILLIPAYFLAWLANRIQRVRPEQPSAEGAH